MSRTGKLVPVYRCEHTLTRDGPWSNSCAGTAILDAWEDLTTRPNLWFDGFKDYKQTHDCRVVVPDKRTLEHWFPRSVHWLLTREHFHFVEYQVPEWSVLLGSSKLQGLVNVCFLHSPREIRL